MKLNDLSHVEEGEPAGRPHDDCVVREPAAGGCGDSGHSQREEIGDSFVLKSQG
jgi:hypothetical protein